LKEVIVMKKLAITIIVVAAIVAVGVIGADFMPTVSGAMPKPGG
jgi:hypothetical protein